MIFTESSLRGAFTIDMVRAQDERGFFARSFDAEEFTARGLPGEMPQSSVSYNFYRAPCAACIIRRLRTARTSSCGAPRGPFLT